MSELDFLNDKPRHGKPAAKSVDENVDDVKKEVDQEVDADKATSGEVEKKAPLPGSLLPSSGVPSKPKVPATHKVVAKDNLHVIAKKYGVAKNDLQAANKGVDFKALQLDQTVKLPQK